MCGCERWRTVVRCASKELLCDYFNRERLFPNLSPRDLSRSGCIAACQMSDAEKRAVTEDELNHVYAFAKSPACLERTLEDAELRSVDLSGLKSQRTAYDRALYLCMYHRDLWRTAVSFLNVDALPKQVWCRCAGLPRKTPETAPGALHRLGAEIATYYREKRQCAQFWETEQRNRSGSLYAYFVYFSDVPNFKEVWNDGGERTETLQTNVRNAVFYYDSLTGALDVFCWGGTAIARDLQRIFCRVILDYELTEAQILKYGFQLNHLKFRGNAPKPVPTAGVMDVRLNSMTLSYADAEMKHSHRTPRNGSPSNDAFYDSLEQYAHSLGMPLGLFSVKKAEMDLTVELNGIRSTLRLILTRNSCTLRSYSDAVRMAGEHFLRENRIDVQSPLF